MSTYLDADPLQVHTKLTQSSFPQVDPVHCQLCGLQPLLPPPPALPGPGPHARHARRLLLPADPRHAALRHAGPAPALRRGGARGPQRAGLRRRRGLARHHGPPRARRARDGQVGRLLPPRARPAHGRGQRGPRRARPPAPPARARVQRPQPARAAAHHPRVRGPAPAPAAGERRRARRGGGGGEALEHGGVVQLHHVRCHRGPGLWRKVRAACIPDPSFSAPSSSSPQVGR